MGNQGKGQEQLQQYSTCHRGFRGLSQLVGILTQEKPEWALESEK